MRPQLSSAFSPPAQRPPVPIVIIGGGLDLCPVRVDLTAELAIRRVGASDGIEASLAGDVVAEKLKDESRFEPDRRQVTEMPPESAPWTPARITASRVSSLPLGPANPFAWLQLMDQVGRPLTEQVFLGPGVDTCYSLHSRFETEAVRHRSIANVAARMIAGAKGRKVAGNSNGAV